MSVQLLQKSRATLQFKNSVNPQELSLLSILILVPYIQLMDGDQDNTLLYSVCSRVQSQAGLYKSRLYWEVHILNLLVLEVLSIEN